MCLYNIYRSYESDTRILRYVYLSSPLNNLGGSMRATCKVTNSVRL